MGQIIEINGSKFGRQNFIEDITLKANGYLKILNSEYSHLKNASYGKTELSKVFRR